MIKLKLSLIAIVLASVSIGCKMKKVLPDATEEGKNTFGVKIDGKVWLPVQKGSIVGGRRSLIAGYYKDEGVFAITATKGADEEINLTVINVKSTGSYFFNVDKSKASETKYDGNLVDDEYFPYTGGTNKMNIVKLDTINKIVSGTFEVQLMGKKNSSIKNLTQGIFDVKYEN